MNTLEKLEDLISKFFDELEGDEYEKLTAYTSFVGNYLVIHVHNGESND